jgi:hypothetical protein
VHQVIGGGFVLQHAQRKLGLEVVPPEEHAHGMLLLNSQTVGGLSTGSATYSPGPGHCWAASQGAGASPDIRRKTQAVADGTKLRTAEAFILGYVKGAPGAFFTWRSDGLPEPTLSGVHAHRLA